MKRRGKSFTIRLAASDTADQRLLALFGFRADSRGLIARFPSSVRMAAALVELRRGGWHGTHSPWPPATAAKVRRRKTEVPLPQAEIDRNAEARAKRALAFALRGRPN